MLKTLELFNQQQEKREEIRAQIAELQNEINRLEKQGDKLCDDAINEGDVMCDALEAAGFYVDKLQRPYNQVPNSYTIVRIVRIESLPVLCELDRATGILLLDGKAAQTLNPVLP